ncbi:hypothetical protein JYQ62_14630 [Nostoc sp. UHCC 0702]|nr:hypothetical protein JYQ62_14630 [Nostoc sp. UHCC 0702]
MGIGNWEWGAGEQGSRGAGEQGSGGAGEDKFLTPNSAPPNSQSPIPNPQYLVPNPMGRKFYTSFGGEWFS